MKFASRVFRWAGIYGLIALVPMYFLEDRIGRDNPPIITHPEFFYGFIGVGVAFQVVFLIIAQDPVRYRPLMLASVIEKLTFVAAALGLILQGRLTGPIIGGAAMDLVLMGLFIAAYQKTPRSTSAP